MIQLFSNEPSDPARVGIFLQEFTKDTGYGWWQRNERRRELDERIRKANLNLADKVDVFRKLSPEAEYTSDSEELRMECLILSLSLTELACFKFALDYDGDCKDLVEYIFHDIDNKKYQENIIKHFQQQREPIGIKVLSDVDDTMYANLLDERYPKKTLYPGVLEFYDALKRESFSQISSLAPPLSIPITTLSARPGLFNLEKKSLCGLVELTNSRLCPSGLSGKFVSSSAGTIGSLLRQKLECQISAFDKQENEIGVVKYENFLSFAQVYPEYRYVFVGDSGQADSLTAQYMMTGEVDLSKNLPKAITTFIHDIRQSRDDEGAASLSFKNLDQNIRIGRDSTTGRGVIIFRNYIEAATIAYIHSVTLENLITLDGLAKITRSALEQFQEINFLNKEASGLRLRDQYREDAKISYEFLRDKEPMSETLSKDISEIARILNEGF